MKTEDQIDSERADMLTKSLEERWPDHYLLQLKEECH